MSTRSPLRIGAVPFSNTFPLQHFLPETYPEAEIVRGVPSELAGPLADGQLDVALISTIELLRHPEYGYVPGLGICSDGPVRSVMLFSREVPEKVKSLALDIRSLSSVVLGRILFDQYWNNNPRIESYTPPIENGLKIADAALCIGDTSMEYENPDVLAYDLGDAWKAYCSLPFVYAAWITRAGIDPARIAEPFVQAYELGMSNLDALAEEAARDSRLPPAFFMDYFTQNIYYPLGEREQEGLRFYFDRARKFIS